jgi:hypothetical protein
MVKVKAEIEIDESRIADLICTGFEGGMTGSWAQIFEHDVPKPEDMFKWDRDKGDETVFPHVHYPMSKGGVLWLRDAEEYWDEWDDREEEGSPHPLCSKLGEVDGVWRMDRESVDKGIELFFGDPRWAHHASDFMRENEDAITGDVFVQLCVLGDVVYG